MLTLNEIGATVLANACGPCIGQWNRPEMKPGEPNTIVTSFNRNFPGRNDGRRETMAFMGSPELIVALALGGRLSFNPLKDSLKGPDGKEFKLEPPKKAPEVPSKGFSNIKDVYVAPATNPDEITVAINPTSGRLQKLEPFLKWDGKDFVELPLLLKAKGKCTTDHISPAGAWLSLRGHIDKISDNVFLGAVNAFTNDVGKGKNQLNGNIESFPVIARQYKEKGLKWIVIGDNNYGEGSSREHAAMSPRYLGCGAVIARSFARIHETNLKKQGVLALTFVNPADYDKVQESDKISLLDLSQIAPGKNVTCMLLHKDGTKDEILLKHSYNDFQIKWFKAGSALNIMREREAQAN
jgi:aconitate hydratase